MYVIVKYVPNINGIEMPVLIIDTHSEVLEFDSFEEAEKTKNIFQSNTDSGYRYVVKKVGAPKEERFTYPGYLSSEAQEFFKDVSFKEKHPNVEGVSGTFIHLSDGSTHLPFKGETFIKDEHGKITLCEK